MTGVSEVPATYPDAGLLPDLFGLNKPFASHLDPFPIERWSAPQFTGYLRKLFSVFVRSSTQ